MPDRITSSVCQVAAYPDGSMLAQASAATVAASRTAALPVSVRRNWRSGVCRFCVHTVRRENGEAEAPGSVTPGFSRAPLQHTTETRLVPPGQGPRAVMDEKWPLPEHDGPELPGHSHADAMKMIAATRAFAAAMGPFSTGASYLNFTHEADRVWDAYGDAKYARLAALKDTYDPANLFRLNQNIRPSHPAAEPALA